ncbi:MAG: hypothetical protein Q8L41_09810 [Anaerolineales bacterium]|nr:hypothetical protein [Anaerolineales bacterium]
MDNQKPQTSPLTYILIGVVIVLLLQYLFSNNQTQSSSPFQQSNPTVNPYEECITWQETEYHDGETVCVIGKILFVDNSYDDTVQESLWAAYFGMSENSFQVRAWGDSLDEWQDKCVVIRGTLIDRSKQDPRWRNKAPAMVNSEFSSDFAIREAPVGLCQ